MRPRLQLSQCQQRFHRALLFDFIRQNEFSERYIAALAACRQQSLVGSVVDGSGHKSRRTIRETSVESLDVSRRGSGEINAVVWVHGPRENTRPARSSAAVDLVKI